MNKMKISMMALAIAAGLGASSFASAGEISCFSPDPPDSGVNRTWTFDSATACGTGPGNADETSLEALFPLVDPYNWEKGGDIQDWISWTPAITEDQKDVSGTWTLDAGFWDIFGLAAITIHVGGNPQVPPSDYGAFLIEFGEYTGTWSYVQSEGGVVGDGQGGGWSNFQLWTALDEEGDPFLPPDPPEVPEPGTLLLLGSALVGLGLRRRKA